MPFRRHEHDRRPTWPVCKGVRGRPQTEAQQGECVLHEAQLQLRKEIIAKWGDDRPYYWAAFVLVGR